MTQRFILHKSDDGRAAVLQNVHTFLDRLPDSQSWCIEIKRYVRERSDLQNRALWKCAYQTLSDATGHDAEDLHTYFCGERWGWVESEVLGQKKRKPRRTTTTDEHGRRDVISTVELSEFYAFVQQRAAETVGIYIPDPDPMWFRNRDQP